MHTTSRRAAAVAAAALVTAFLAGCTSTVVGSAQPGPTPSKTSSPRTPPRNSLEVTNEVVTSAAGAALMAKFRAADLCQALDPEPMKKYGNKQNVVMGPGLHACKILSGNSGTEDPVYRYEISMKVYTEVDRAKDLEEEVGDRKVYRSKPSPSDKEVPSYCGVYVPIDDTGYALSITGYKSVAKGEKATWPEACEETKAYVGVVAPKLLAFPARTTQPAGRSLLGKDPCDKQQQFLGEFPGWSPGGVSRYNPYGCQIALTKPDDAYSYTLGVQYLYNVEQEVTADTPAVTIAGLSGIRLNKPFMDLPESCTVNLTYRPSEPKGTFTGHLIRVELSPKQLKPQLGQKAPPQSLKPCDVVDKVATTVVQGLG